MKKKLTTSLLTAALCFFLSACNTATPENYFDQAVLNCNMMMGFASTGMERSLDQPSVRLVAGTTDKTAPMTRKEVVNDKIQYLEASFKKIQDLHETDDTREMLNAAKAVYNYVLPVYKNEYLQLARLYDEGAPKQEIATFSGNIQQKYFPGFQKRFDALVAAGKPYAVRHKINVNWDVNSSPTP